MLLLLSTVLLFSTNIVTLLGGSPGENFVFAGTSDTPNTSQNNNAVKNNFNLNFDLNEGVYKNITVKKVNENETTILIKDIEPEG